MRDPLHRLETPISEEDERTQARKALFIQTENTVAEALRDTHVPYTIYSSVAFDRQMDRVIRTILGPKEKEGDAVATALAARARAIIAQPLGDIDGVVKTREDLRAVRRTLLSLNEFVPDPSVGSTGEVHIDSDGFRSVYGEDETVVFSGYFRYPDPFDPNREPVTVPVEFYCEQKINTPKLQEMAEVIDAHGLRVLSLPALREQYANTLMYEQEVDHSIEEKRAILRRFSEELTQKEGDAKDEVITAFAGENGFSDQSAATAYIEEFVRIEDRINGAADEGERARASSEMTAFLEGLKTKTAKRREKVHFLDDLNYFLETGEDPKLRGT